MLAVPRGARAAALSRLVHAAVAVGLPCAAARLGHGAAGRLRCRRPARSSWASSVLRARLAARSSVEPGAAALAAHRAQTRASVRRLRDAAIRNQLRRGCLQCEEEDGRTRRGEEPHVIESGFESNAVAIASEFAPLQVSCNCQTSQGGQQLPDLYGCMRFPRPQPVTATQCHGWPAGSRRLCASNPIQREAWCLT